MDRVVGWVGRRRERCARGLGTFVNSSAGPKLNGEVIHKAPLVQERSSLALNERWQLFNFSNAWDCSPWSCVRNATASRSRPAPRGACVADQRQQPRVPMENSFPACLLLHAPWKNPAGSSLRSQEDVGVS